MGRLHPADFSLDRLKDRAERTMVTTLLDGTDNYWVVMPDVHIAETPPAQVDIVLAHPVYGVAVIEVKGYHPEIRGGLWRGPYENEGVGPPGQLNRNQRAVESVVRAVDHSLRNVHVPGAVAFVNARGFKTDERPRDLMDRQILWSGDLDEIDEALLRVVPKRSPDNPVIPPEFFDRVVRALRPDVEFENDPVAYAAWARQILERIGANHVKVLERLDANRRVYVTGGAGTGKSRLAVAWARRSQIGRVERTLLVCFNEALGHEFRHHLGDYEDLEVGAYFPVSLELDGMPPLVIPPGRRDDPDFWNNEVNGHLHLHWPLITERFDTIIVDEVQDFSPAWLAQLEALLDPDGPRRMLLIGDVHQQIHQRGFVPPRPEDGWTLCELVVNTRNSFAIARLLKRRLGGPNAPRGAPESTHLRHRDLPDPVEPEALRAAVTDEIVRLRSEGFGDDSIAVVCLDSSARDLLRQSSQFCRWEDRAEGRVVCETVRRLKGLEYETVVMVASRWPIDDTLLYVAVSRAVLGLTVIGPPGLGERLGLEPTTE